MEKNNDMVYKDCQWLIEEIEQVSISLLLQPIEKGQNQIFKIIERVENMEGMNRWTVRIAWGIYNNDAVMIRDSLIYGIKPMLCKAESENHENNDSSQ